MSVQSAYSNTDALAWPKVLNLSKVDSRSRRYKLMNTVQLPVAKARPNQGPPNQNQEAVQKAMIAELEDQVTYRNEELKVVKDSWFSVLPV